MRRSWWTAPATGTSRGAPGGPLPVAGAAGAAFDVGRTEDGLVQPMTLMFRMVQFFQPGFAEYVRQNPDQWRGVHGLWELLPEATEAGELQLPREDILFFATPHPQEGSVNST